MPFTAAHNYIGYIWEYSRTLFKDRKSNIDTLFKAQTRKKDKLFKGKKIANKKRNDTQKDLILFYFIFPISL